MERIKLNLVPTGMVENVHASQYDIARTFRFDLMDGESVFTLDGTETITVDVTKPDGTQTTISVDNTSSSYVDVVTPAGVCDLSGSANCELRIVKGGVEIGSQNFSIKIESDPHDDKIVLRTASGIIALFNTDLGGIAVDVTSALPYNANGYTSASAINSKTTPVFDLAPYLTRANTNTGNLAFEKLVGLTVCFNQLAPNNFNASTVSEIMFDSGTTITAGHKYFMSRKIGSVQNVSDGVYAKINGSNVLCFQISQQKTEAILQSAYSGTAAAASYIEGAVWIYHNSDVPVTDLNIIDLTQMFGSEIADYLYTLESETEGAGVSVFKTLFPSEYYPYTANILMSAKPTGKKIVGKNLYDISNQTSTTTNTYLIIDVFPNTDYVFSIDIIQSGIYIEQYVNGAWTDLAVAYGDTKKAFNSGNNTQLRLSTYSSTSELPTEYQLELGSTATAYEPYSETTIVYSGNELRGLIKVVDGKLVADGDIDDGSGSTDIRYEERAYQSGDESLANAITDGTNTVVKLATSTTATSTAWSNPIVAKQGGTETFVDNRTIALPTGHDTIYGTDLVVKTADFGQTVFGGSVDFTTGEVISNKNADGTDKTPETIAISPVMVGVFEGNNNIVTTAGGNNTVKYYKGA